ncbi:MAG: glycosyltransferase family 4 protein [Sedimentisphaerales bacterium]|nr:glycosyltransferase family 4 protein [Sedimentisphaerales bacterium]
MQIFDEVMVFARVTEIKEEKLPKLPATGPNIRFFEMPTFIGPWQYLKLYSKLNTLAKKVASENDVFILRIPGTMANLLEKTLKKRKYPYGVEVVGDPWDSFSPGGVKSILRPVARLKICSDMKRQCHMAAAASYVTQYILQERYPTDCWSTHYSSIELPDGMIAGQSELESRFSRLEKAVANKGGFRICHIGSMSALYKAQDVLIEAIACCIKKGFNLEAVFLGDGRYLSIFENKAREFNISDRINFAGRVPAGQQVMSYLDSSDIFVLPSITEGLPRSLIEAMSRGLPCIGSDVGGIKELLLEEDRVVPGNAEKLADKLIAIMTDLDKMKEMSARNLEKSKEYRSSELNKRRIEFYEKVIEATKKHITDI